MSDAEFSVIESTTEQPQAINMDSFSMSTAIDKLAEALAKAQLEMVGAVKDSNNPFFKSKYADLANVLDAIKPCNKYGLSIVQMPSSAADGAVKLTTMLMHSSGQWIQASYSVKPVKADPQGVGSCITYMRRYAAAAFAGVAQVDDDGNSASGKQVADEKITESQVLDIQALIDEVGAVKSDFIKWAKVGSLEDIPESRYKTCINALEAKRKQVKK